MSNPLPRLLHRLSVGKKLLLIYLLDLSAVIFVSGILINEKFIAIDFARKELEGNAYIMALREPILGTVRASLPTPAPVPSAQDRSGPTLAEVVRSTERRHGAQMDSAAASEAFAESLARLDEPLTGTERTTAQATALTRGRNLLTRIGNKSNLILDPDLDSYYTMSLVLLRYPELVELIRDITGHLQDFIAAGGPMSGEMRTRYFILEGRLDAAAQGIESDFNEAYLASPNVRLRDALEPKRIALSAAIERFRNAGRVLVERGAEADVLASQQAAQVEMLRQLDDVWSTSSIELDRLINTRIDGFFQRMWLHLGTALSLLCIILGAVFFVARQIALPLRRLASVAETVSRIGNHGIRAEWDSSDEIGRLVTRFNEMLAQLDRVRASEQELAASARAAIAQRELVEAVPIPMVVTTVPNHEVLHANGPAEAWLAGRRTDPWAEGLAPHVRSRFFQRLSDEDVIDEFEVRWHGSAEPTWAVLSARRLVYQGMDAVVTSFTPINRMKMLERRLGLWAKVFEVSSESIVIVDADKRILSVNRSFCRRTSHDARDVVGERPDFLFGPDAPVQSFDGLWPIVESRGAWQGEVEIRRRDDSTYPAWMVINGVRDSAGLLTHYICTSLDISERKESEQRIHFLAHHDALTGLPNRALCTERLRVALHQAERSGDKVAVLFIDLDHFKTINDSLGHHVGDALLRSVSNRLLEAVRDGDTVSRLGGDEFIVVLSRVADAAEVLAAVEKRLVPLIRAPHRVHGEELQVSCSVGMALYPDDGEDIDVLMRHADVAMYQAKMLGRDSAQFFTPELNDRAHRKLNFQSLLRHAVDRGELSLHYQPRIAAADGRVMGVEALLRWQSPEFGAVSPADFIPIAEESKLIEPIGAWVLREALRQHTQWKSDGVGEVPVSINVSGVQLKSGNLVATLRDALHAYGVTPSAVELELTESALIEGVDHTVGQLQALKALGIKLSVDDFGTGYSSLTYLNRFPVDRIKVDRSFIGNLLTEPADLAITRAIIGLGHTLGLSVVAEGVESEAVAAVLRAAHCDELQGFHYAHPMPPAEFVEWFERRLLGAPVVAAAADSIVASDRSTRSSGVAAAGCISKDWNRRPRTRRAILSAAPHGRPHAHHPRHRVSRRPLVRRRREALAAPRGRRHGDDRHHAIRLRAGG